MAILFQSRVFSCSIPPSCAFSTAKTRFRFSAVKTRAESGASGAAIVWYKHDLRIEDHPGLAAASEYRNVVPIYIFDYRIVSRFSDEMLEILLFALEDLRKLLKEQGSNLMIKFGNAENVVEQLVEEDYNRSRPPASL